MNSNVHHLYGKPDEAALAVLRDKFDIADVGPSESVASLRYNLGRIDLAEQAITKIEDPKERRTYQDWLHFFRSKTETYLNAAIAL